MNIAITGASGLIGSALIPLLTRAGHEIVRLTRSASEHDSDRDPDSDDSNAVGRTVAWDPAAGTIDASALEGVDAAFHFAGESIAGDRWTRAKKRRIRDSRVQGTHLLATTLAQQPHPPATLICASAVGYYGDRGETTLDENSAPGDTFLANVCQAWEDAAAPARHAGIRVVHLRFGPVMAREGGALAQMLPPFKLGLGGVVGSGDQYMSWIALDDAVGVALHVLDHPDISGPINTVAPQPLTNRDFTKTLGDALDRPTAIPLPAFAARLAFGELADELLLASTRVDAGLIERHGYDFRWPDLALALDHLLD